MEILNVSPAYHDDRAFTPVNLRLAWSPADKTNHGAPGGRLVVGTLLRVGLYRATGAGTWEALAGAYLYGGIDGGGTDLYAKPEDPNATYFVELVQGWCPLVAHGVWWPKVERWNGAAWVVVPGTNTYGASGFPERPITVIPRALHEETIRTRQGFPQSRFLAGPTILKQEA